MEAIRVQSQGDKLTVRVTARSHEFLADEPKGSSDDRGPTPYELLLASLGA